MAEHNTLTGTQLHEPKGAADALANQVYVADGTASGSFQLITFDSLNGISQMPVQADSTAVDVPGLVTDLNALIAKLKTAGLMAS